MEHPVVSREKWIELRKQLLAEEKEFVRMRDRLSVKRRALPWVRIEKDYTFDAPEGKVSLGDLFDGRSQLIVKHFMFGPDWEEGCVGCSFESDHAEAALVHLAHRDVAYVAVARTPIAKIEAYRRRMGWTFRWVSSLGNDFNFDFNVSFTPEQVAAGACYYNYQTQPAADEMSGRSVFMRDESGAIFHTYSSFARGGEIHLGTYAYLDIVPKGRQETAGGNLSEWVHRHDSYDDER
jgi:predicted dithiol-disulfide oxidoreductase (DUF899 family)